MFVPGYVDEGLTVKEVLERTNDYVVYISKQNTVESHATKEIEKKIKDNPETHSLLRRWGFVQSLPTDHLYEQHQLAYNRMLGNGIAAVFSGDASVAAESIAQAENFFNKRNSEQARLWYLYSAVGTFLILGGISGLIVRNRAPGADCASTEVVADGGQDDVDGEPTPKTKQDGSGRDYASLMRSVKCTPLSLCFLFGTCGALCSVLMRLKKVPSDASAGQVIHYVDGAARIALGGFFGMLGGMAFLSDLFLTSLKPEPTSLGIALCIVAAGAGLVEQLIPNLVTSFEKKS